MSLDFEDPDLLSSGLNSLSSENEPSIPLDTMYHLILDALEFPFNTWFSEVWVWSDLAWFSLCSFRLVLVKPSKICRFLFYIKTDNFSAIIFRVFCFVFIFSPCPFTPLWIHIICILHHLTWSHRSTSILLSVLFPFSLCFMTKWEEVWK